MHTEVGRAWPRILVQVTIYRRLLIGRDGHLDQSEAYDISIDISDISIAGSVLGQGGRCRPDCDDSTTVDKESIQPLDSLLLNYMWPICTR